MRIISPAFWARWHAAQIHDHVNVLIENWQKQSRAEEMWIYADIFLLVVLLLMYAGS